MEFYCHEIYRNVLVLVANGDINGQTATQLVQSVQKLAYAGLKKIIIDCCKLNYIDSTGVGVPIRLHKRMRARGEDVKICSGKGVFARLLEKAGLGQLFDIYEDLNLARLVFRPSDP